MVVSQSFDDVDLLLVGVLLVCKLSSELAQDFECLAHWTIEGFDRCMVSALYSLQYLVDGV